MTEIIKTKENELECPICHKITYVIIERNYGKYVNMTKRCYNCWCELDVDEKYCGDRLQYLVTKQKELHNKIVDGNNRYPSSTEEQVQLLMTALIHEAVEVQRLTNWKWWKQPNKTLPINHLKEELIDILHFWLDAVDSVGMSPEEIVRQYERKNQINHHRQENGY